MAMIKSLQSNTATKILFVLKFRQGSGGPVPPYAYNYFNSGLYWSAKFVVDMLQDKGVNAKLVEVIDNNDIDREITIFQPDVVIIEALWVVPSKFDVLMKLHPDVQFVVRVHSNVTFLANEGMAMGWLKEYDARGVTIAVNDKRMIRDVESIIESDVLYLPNFYPVRERLERSQHDDGVLRVACFGAIRPLKNQLIQAVSAIQFADSIGKYLDFHVNGTRSEMGGNSVLENLRALFKNTVHRLVEHDWMTHRVFLDVLSTMDIGMQVSLSETFSIVSADMVSVGLPIVVSPEVGWANTISKAAPTNSEDIVDKLGLAYSIPSVNIGANRVSLRHFSSKSKDHWLDLIRPERNLNE